MICDTCDKETSSTANGECYECAEKSRQAWAEKMAIRQDASKFDAQKLINYLLSQHWMHEVRIIPDYMPPFPREDTRPRCAVYFTYKDGKEVGLRYSRGPLQGFGWDTYSDDFHSPELALIAISQAPAPPRVDVVIPTYGR